MAGGIPDEHVTIEPGAGRRRSLRCVTTIGIDAVIGSCSLLAPSRTASWWLARTPMSMS